ncbi:Tannase and feruloyl esterase (plasmid) [Variovorax sp. SRS16]|uniref:tannase/feruloyl esterase family alpha/beta hydrolase n=1 Tax=Variovorax sp. SRS16 TaxID=282217 RepID=UPI0013184634|nr:tannase/feruloyl esterase family alpha/beta hydrolase [Variovorax sp. SRS16]VTU46151.1 Tannase and feruloyl esterase [Variovorax sp. SRS16]
MNAPIATTHLPQATLSVLATAVAAALALSACSRSSDVVADGAAVNTPQACSALATGVALPPNTRILAAVFEAATPTQPVHCRIDGDIDDRVGVDGQHYATRFRLRMPQDWNRRFYMSGGGGTNGVLVDPVAVMAQGYATIGTDAGHDNALNSRPDAGGTAAFGLDPQARMAFAYAAYDQVTRVGKLLTRTYYGQPQRYAYFQGCSEGGREALLMSQRFPEHYDGIIAGDPTLHLPLGPLAGIYTTKLFAGLARRTGKTLPDGQPAIGLTFSDLDLLLVRNAVLKACDALDGLSDGIVVNLPACTGPRVHTQLLAMQCAQTKTDSCLSADQIETLETAYAGAVDSKGRQLYASWPWDPGMGGVSAKDNSYNQTWRSWWLGSANAAANNAIKLSYVSAISVLYTSAPKLPFTGADALPFSLAYDFDTDPARIYSTSAPGATPVYAPSSAVMYFTDTTDLSSFRKRGGKLMVYHGGADSSVSINDTLRWYEGVARQSGGNAQDFARMYVVPGMNHCRGGPATDSFDMLPQLVQWVEGGTAPESVVAKASNPGYFNVDARSRPLCTYPRQARYKGTGDINDAANFRCE